MVGVAMLGAQQKVSDLSKRRRALSVSGIGGKCMAPEHQGRISESQCPEALDLMTSLSRRRFPLTSGFRTCIEEPTAFQREMRGIPSEN